MPKRHADTADATLRDGRPGKILKQVDIHLDPSAVGTTIVRGSQSSPRSGSPVITKPSLKESKKTANESKSKEPSISPLPTSFTVVAGSYEKLLYGIEGTFADEQGQSTSKPLLKPVFIFPAHVSCVKAVAASPDGGKWLATGSTDEIVKVWDLRRRKEIGGLIQHEGSITHLSFPSRSHLLSASEDGTICLFRARDWTLLRSLKGHKGRINSVAVHPSGKVGLSVGKDRTLRMWDMMRGKGSASTKLGKEGELVRWSSTGHRFIVQAQAAIDVYSTDMALLHTVTHTSRVHDVKFCRRVVGDGELLLVAGEDKKVTIYSVDTGTNTSLPIVGELIGHANRVKALDMLSIALPQSEDSIRKSTTIVSTVSSDGKIRIFDLADLPSSPPEEGGKTEIHAIAEYDTKGTRLTCCTLAGILLTTPASSGTKRKRKDEEQEESGEESDGESSWHGVDEHDEDTS